MLERGDYHPLFLHDGCSFGMALARALLPISAEYLFPICTYE